MPARPPMRSACVAPRVRLTAPTPLPTQGKLDQRAQSFHVTSTGGRDVRQSDMGALAGFLGICAAYGVLHAAGPGQ